MMMMTNNNNNNNENKNISKKINKNKQEHHKTQAKLKKQTIHSPSLPSPCSLLPTFPPLYQLPSSRCLLPPTQAPLEVTTKNGRRSARICFSNWGGKGGTGGEALPAASRNGLPPRPWEKEDGDDDDKEGDEE